MKTIMSSVLCLMFVGASAFACPCQEGKDAKAATAKGSKMACACKEGKECKNCKECTSKNCEHHNHKDGEAKKDESHT